MYHPYALRIVQELTDVDKSHRRVFAETEFQLLKAGPGQFHFFFSSDKSTFTSMGLTVLQRHREQPLNSSRVSVWGAILKGGAVGSVFFEDIGNGTNKRCCKNFSSRPVLTIFPLVNDKR